jgi:NAD kinase
VALAPRVVVVYRRSELEELTERYSNRRQVEFFLRTRGRSIDTIASNDASETEARREVGVAVPADWRRIDVEREDLPRFLFAPEDIVAVVGRDGLVANVAKYVDDQPVIGFNPVPASNAGVLTQFDPRSAASVLVSTLRRHVRTSPRTMVAATLDDGQVIAALNDVYIGDRGHQSARYSLRTPDGFEESQSSSGVIVGTGTGATGWLASLAHDRELGELLPRPEDAALSWFVREAWPSPFTGVAATAGAMRDGAALTLTVESDELVVFGDGIEGDRVAATAGQRVSIAVAPRRLNLVVAGEDRLTVSVRR